MAMIVPPFPWQWHVPTPTMPPATRARHRVRANYQLGAAELDGLADLLGVLDNAYEDLPAECRTVYSQLVARLGDA